MFDDSAGGDTDNDGSKNSPNPNDWIGIQFSSTSTASVLDHVVVNYGGNYGNGEVEADGAAPTIENSTIANSGASGVQLIGSNATLTGDTFLKDGFAVDAVVGAIDIDLASQPVISGITVTDNPVNGVSVEGGNLPAGTTTWNNPAVVYWLGGNVTVPTGSTLVIDPGQVVKFGDFGATTLTVQGTLQAQGTAAQPIIFTSKLDDSAGGDTNNDGSKTSPQAADWSSIQFTATSTNSMLDQVLVNYGGVYVGGEVEANGSVPTIENCTIANSGSSGVQLVGSDATLTGDTFLKNGFHIDALVGAIDIDAASQPVMSGITLTNNNLNGVSVEGGTLPAGTVTWNNPSVVYWLNGNVTVPASGTLLIDPGQVIKFGGLAARRCLL